MNASQKTHAMYCRPMALLTAVLCFTGIWTRQFAVAGDGDKPSLDDIAQYLRSSLANIDRDDAVYYNDDGKKLVVEVGNHQGSYTIIRIGVDSIQSVSVSGNNVIVSRTAVSQESQLRVYPVIDIRVYDGKTYGDSQYPVSVTLVGKSPQDAKRIAKAIQYLMERAGNPYLSQERESKERKEEIDKTLGVE
jgi:hypothetical protein